MAHTVGFLGPLGTYSEEAALLYDPTSDKPYPTITAVGEAVASGEIDEGIVPIENSLAGSVIFTLDLLISQPKLFIRGEIDLPIEHYLVAKPGTDPAAIKVIYSHPQALAQCQEYLKKKYPQAVQMASLSTVLSVTDSFDSPVPAAAISPRRATEHYDVDILDRAFRMRRPTSPGSQSWDCRTTRQPATTRRPWPSLLSKIVRGRSTGS